MDRNDMIESRLGSTKGRSENFNKVSMLLDLGGNSSSSLGDMDRSSAATTALGQSHGASTFSAHFLRECGSLDGSGDVFLQLCDLLSTVPKSSTVVLHKSWSEVGNRACTSMPAVRRRENSLPCNFGRPSKLSASHVESDDQEARQTTPPFATGRSASRTSGRGEGIGGGGRGPDNRPRIHSSGGLAAGCWEFEETSDEGLDPSFAHRPPQKAEWSLGQDGARNKLKESIDSSCSFHLELSDLEVRARDEEWIVNPEDIVFEEKLGEGDCAVVYKAQWRSMTVVSKQLRNTGDHHGYTSCLPERRARADLMNEISILSRLRHPNIVLFLGACFVEAGSLCLISEYMSGGSLEFFFQDGGLSSIAASHSAEVNVRDMVIMWSRDIFQALCFLHNCDPPVIHRDLKPANLLLDDCMRLKVCDFSLSRSVRRQSVLRYPYQMTGRTGTLRYMAPEVMAMNQAGVSSYNEKVDIYSAANLMWFMCMGMQPFGDLTSDTVMMGVMKGLRPDLYSVKRKCGKDMADLIARGWSPNPDARPSADQMLEVMKGMRCSSASWSGKKNPTLSPTGLAKLFMQRVRRSLLPKSSQDPFAEPDRRVHGGKSLSC